MLTRRHVLHALASAALLLPSRPGHGNPGGIGGTGVAGPLDGGGIGGTGFAEPVDGGGIGGTGILGTLTQFGSIWVNGVEIELPADLPVAIEGRPATSDALRIGQQVAVAAHWHAGDLVAALVEVRYQAAGPVDRVAADGSALTLLGQRVDLSGVPDGPAVRSGDRIAVSGLRRADGTIVASRLDPWPADRGWLLRGRFEAGAAGVALAGLPLALPPGAPPPPAGPGRAEGIWFEGRPAPTLVSADPLNPFGAAVERLSLEAVTDAAGRLPPDLQSALADGTGSLPVFAPDSRVLVDGTWSLAGGFRPERSAGAPGIGGRGLPGQSAPTAADRFGRARPGPEPEGRPGGRAPSRDSPGRDGSGPGGGGPGGGGPGGGGRGGGGRGGGGPGR